MGFKFILLLVFCLILSSKIFSQTQNPDQELGARTNLYRAGLYDFSDPGAINIRVSVWGYVSRPGKYIVPDYTTVSDLLSFAGGPDQNAEMDDLRIYRTLENGKEEMIKFTYDDIMWSEKIVVNHRLIPKLEPSDILIIPGSPRFFFKDWFNVGLQIVSVLVALVNVYLLVQYNK